MLPELQKFKKALSIRTEFSSQLCEDILLTGMCLKKKKQNPKTKQIQKNQTKAKQNKPKTTH